MLETLREVDSNPIAPGEVRSFDLDLAADEFLLIEVDQEGIDLALRLDDPEGRTVVRVDSPTGEYGPEELVAIAPAPGRYRLSVEALAGGAQQGHYLLRPITRRAATGSDRELVEADRADREGQVLLAQGGYQAALERLFAALAVFAQRGLARREAETRFAIAMAHMGLGAVRPAAQECDLAAGRYPKDADPRRSATLLDWAGWLHLRLGEPQQALSPLSEAVEVCEAAGDRPGLVSALAHLASAFQALGRLDEAVAAFERAVSESQAVAGPQDREAALLVDQGSALVASGRAAEARDRFERAEEIALLEGLAVAAALARKGIADAASRLGDHAPAQEKAGEAVASLRGQGDGRALALGLVTLGQARRRGGDLAGARPAFEEALALVRQAADLRSEAVILVELGHLHTETGDPATGFELCDQALALFLQIGDAKGEASARRRRQEASDRLGGAPASGGDGSLGAAISAAGEGGGGSTRGEDYGSIAAAGGPKKPVGLLDTDLPGDGGRPPRSVWTGEAEAVARRERRRQLEAERGPGWQRGPGRSGPDLKSPESEKQDQRDAEQETEDDYLAVGQPADDDDLEPPAENPLVGHEPEAAARLVLASDGFERPAYLDELRLAVEYEQAVREERERRRARRELPSDVDPHDLAETGWGIVVSRDEDPAVLYHLRRLIEHRRDEARERFKELSYHPGDSGRTFLWHRNGEAPGVLDPKVMPYYVLVVGGPEAIPFEVQYQLSINHAVGRLFFRETADYGRYADRVIQAEAEGTELPRRAALFSVENGDRTTSLLARHLVDPLAERLEGYADWKLALWRREEATRETLARLLGGEETPGLLLASCHGAEYPFGDERQEERQGALLCPAEPAHGSAPGHGRWSQFRAADLDPGRDLGGLIAFLFACYGAGTPVEDNFPFRGQGGTIVSRPRPRPLTKRPFVARLPQAMLRQGALAVVGHVDRGWTLSFAWTVPGAQTAEAVRSLEDSLKQLLAGHRLGHALRPLHRRYTALAAQLLAPVERRRYGRRVDPRLFAMHWTAHNDARNFVVLGDPAVYALGKRADGGGRGRTASPRAFELDEGLASAVRRAARQSGIATEKWIEEAVRGRLGESKQ